jgi:hypothetical protein
VRNFEEFVLTEYKGTKCLPEGTQKKVLSTPGTVSYGDLDGDCIPDLLMIVKEKGYEYMEIYHQIPKEPEEVDKQIPKFCLVQREYLTNGLSNMLSIADFNQDGSIDLIGYSSKQNRFFVFYNALETAPPSETSLCLDH